MDGRACERVLSRLSCTSFIISRARPRTLVVDDGALVQLSKPVVNGKGQGSAVDPELNVTIRVLPDLDVLPLKTSIFFKQIKLLIVL
nr:Uncharacterised protein [Raoultella sp. NCTC 9187]